MVKSIKKERTVEIMMDGEVIYSARPKVIGTMHECLPLWKNRLAGIKRGMPGAQFSMTVQDLWQDEQGLVHHQLLDVESGELQIDDVD
ncbi:hypothetical protein J7L67_06420 [bacterium]|nr:hypothetical protein [bacterium]